MLKNPSSGVVSVADTCDDLSIEREQLFHGAIMLRTELNGGHGGCVATSGAVSVKYLGLWHWYW